MKNWISRKILEISTVFEDGDWIESKDQSSGGIRLIQTGNVGNGIFKDRGEKARYITEETFRKLRCTEIIEGDCLVSRLPDPVGRACILPDIGEKMITAVDCTIIRFDSKQITPNWFIYYSLSNNYQNEIEKQVTGATRQRISRKNLGLVSIPLPPLPEQQRIVSILEECFAAIEKSRKNAEQNLKNAKELFESYLQGVFENKGEGWEEKKLGESDLVEIIDGDRGKNYPTQKDFLEDGFCLFMNTKNVRPDGFEFETKMFISEAKDKAMGKGKLKRNDVVITTRGTIGNLGVYDDSVEFENIRINSGMLIFRPNTKVITPHYLFETFRSGIFKAQIKKYTTGAAQPQLPIKTLVNFTIPVPKTIEAQQTIVRQLDTLRAETQRLEAVYLKKIADLEELKKSILKKAFSGELNTEMVKTKTNKALAV